MHAHTHSLTVTHTHVHTHAHKHVHTHLPFYTVACRLAHCLNIVSAGLLETEVQSIV